MSTGRNERPCSVMILVTGSHRRGAEVFGELLANSLKHNGWDCRLVALTESATEKSIAAEILFDSSDSADLSGLAPKVVRRLRRLIHSDRPDVVFAGGGATLKYVAAALVGMRPRPRFVYSSIGEPEYWATSKPKRLLLRFLLARADTITAVSHATALQLTRSFGVPRTKVVVAPTGIPEKYLHLPVSRPTSPLKVLFVGSLSNEKDPESAVQAIQLMRNKSILRMIGGGPLAERLSSVNRGNDSVQLIGAVDDVAPHLQWADVLILTSRTEGLPGAAMEAAGAGLPVVAFDVGGVSEIVESGVTGILVPQGDRAALARALDRLADHPELHQSMGRAGREKVRDRFLLATSVELYERVLEGSCKPTHN